MSVQVDATCLNFQDRSANSDKFYRVFVYDSTVVTQYGRNGTYGTFGRKNHGAVAAARNAALKLIDSKVAKGYLIVDSRILDFPAAPTDNDLSGAILGKSGTAKSVDLTISNSITTHTKPMLAENADPKNLQTLLNDQEWVIQPKMDGERVIIEIQNGEVLALNRAGQPKVKNVPQDILIAFEYFDQGRWVFDGEIVGTTLHLFDMPCGTCHDEHSPFSERIEQLDIWINDSGFICEDVVIVPTVEDSYEKEEFFNDAKISGKEGVVFKNINSRYTPGKRSNTMLKYKFVSDVDLIVDSLDEHGKDSVNLKVWDDPRIVGKASIIGKGKIDVGDVVEVRFLYVIDEDNPKLVQPRILRKRTDKAAEECLMTQFKGTATKK